MEALASRANESAWLLGAMFVIIALLIFRSSGLHPVVLNDEYTYSMSSRLLPLSASTIPGYLYLAIYRVTNVCGDGYYDCARVLNSLFFVAAAPFVYAVARNVCSRAAAGVIALATFAGPSTATRRISCRRLFTFLRSGPFVANPAYAGCILDCGDGRRRRADRCCRPGQAARVALPAGRRGLRCLRLSQFGGYAGLRRPLMCAPYSVLAHSRPSSRSACVGGRSRIDAVRLVVHVHRARQHIGHATLHECRRALDRQCMGALSGYGCAVRRALRLHCPGARSGCTLPHCARRYRARGALAFLVLVDLVVVTALFSASTGNAARLHVRYYNFAFPLLLMVVASPAAFRSGAWGRRTARRCGSAPGAGDPDDRVHAFAGNLSQHRRLPRVRRPPGRHREIRLRVRARHRRSHFGRGCRAWAHALSLRVRSRDRGGRHVLHQCPHARAPSQCLRSGRAVCEAISSQGGHCEHAGRGRRPRRVYRALFQLDSPSASMRVLADGSALDLSQLPAGNHGRWWLAITR